MTDEPQLPPEPGTPRPGPADTGAGGASAGGSSDEDRIEALADVIAAEPPPPPPPERGPSKLAVIAVALVALLAGAGTAYAVGNRGGSCPPNGSA
ncbi:MAG: hypothetical protein QOI86_1973, partial [Actinomycetota bacterium]|nr:hypothetical protein [Actinomycetota bacterium]